MSGRMAVLLFFAVTFYTELPRSSAYDWIDPSASEIKMTYPNTKSTTITWKWSLKKRSPNDERLNQLEIKRYKVGDQLDTETTIGLYYGFEGSEKTDTAFFSLKVEKGVPGGKNGKAVFTIKEVTNQGKNKDGTNADVISGNYTYSCRLSVVYAITDPGPRAIGLIVYKKPSIVTMPGNQYISNNDLPVTLVCKVAGQPKPTIIWDVTKISEPSYKSESQIKIEKKEDVGVYNCTARNIIGTVSAVALIQYTECSTGCSFDDQISIEMTQLTYTKEYENSESEKYKKLKNVIEEECLLVYLKHTKQVYSCRVQGFRRGSVVANIKITYPTGLSEPRKPLEDAIKTGTFANQAVKKFFVSPTNLPTESTKPTEKSSINPSDGPDSGKRTSDEGGLSTTSIIALVAVLAVVLLILIVAVVVWMMTRKRPAPQKQYYVDGKSQPAGAPLKLQPYGDLSYHKGPNDGYANIRDLPPQYNSTGYAEPRPSQPNRNAVQLQWNKSDELWI